MMARLGAARSRPRVGFASSSVALLGLILASRRGVMALALREHGRAVLVLHVSVALRLSVGKKRRHHFPPSILSVR